MRRMLLTALASSAFALVAPGVAAASHDEGAHHQHIHRQHRHHARHDGSAGTVASFTNGVLTITLSGGSTVSGKVDGRTELECPAPAPSASMADDHGQGGGDNNGDNDNGDDNGNNDNDNNDNDNDNNDHGGPSNQGQSGDGHQNDASPGCSTAALVSGAVVHEAELKVTGAGSVWETVDLAR
jgi:hypothetical protein